MKCPKCAQKFKVEILPGSVERSKSFTLLEPVTDPEPESAFEALASDLMSNQQARVAKVGQDYMTVNRRLNNQKAAREIDSTVAHLFRGMTLVLFGGILFALVYFSKSSWGMTTSSYLTGWFGILTTILGAVF